MIPFPNLKFATQNIYTNLDKIYTYLKEYER